MTIDLAGPPLVALLLASIRVIAWLVIAPPFSSRTVPSAARVVLGLGLAMAVVPSLSAETVPLDTVGFTLAALQQAVIGLAMGLVTMILFQAVAVAGGLLDTFGGFALSTAMDPLGVTAGSVFARLHQMVATMLLFASGGHLLLIGGLLSSFRLVGLDGSIGLDGADGLVETAFRMLEVVAVQIALPVVSVLVVADLGLALMTKVAPQLNALSVMFPAKIALTLGVVGLSFVVLPEVIDHLTELSLQAMDAVARGAS